MAVEAGANRRHSSHLEYVLDMDCTQSHSHYLLGPNPHSPRIPLHSLAAHRRPASSPARQTSSGCSAHSQHDYAQQSAMRQWTAPQTVRRNASLNSGPTGAWIPRPDLALHSAASSGVTVRDPSLNVGIARQLLPAAPKAEWVPIWFSRL